MPSSAASPIFTPDNEPYLGRELLFRFDRAISEAMAAHRALAPRTYEPNLSALQVAVTEIVPQGVSIALSIRELIRQAYLYSAGILLRPLVERTGMIKFLAGNPTAIEAWQNGWPRKSQPRFQDLAELVLPATSKEERQDTLDLLHKLIHSDPRSAHLNATTRADGRRVSAAGKELTEPTKADAISMLASLCLRQLTRSSVDLLGPPGQPGERPH